jgi:hypothetical protein
MFLSITANWKDSYCFTLIPTKINSYLPGLHVNKFLSLESCFLPLSTLPGLSVRLSVLCVSVFRSLHKKMWGQNQVLTDIEARFVTTSNAEIFEELSREGPFLGGLVRTCGSRVIADWAEFS